MPAKRHHFTPAAEVLWQQIPHDAQAGILAAVWCGHCRRGRQVIDHTGVVQDGDIRIQGFCANCGHVVVRIVETSERDPSQFLPGDRVRIDAAYWNADTAGRAGTLASYPEGVTPQNGCVWVELDVTEFKPGVVDGTEVEVSSLRRH